MHTSSLTAEKQSRAEHRGTESLEVTRYKCDSQGVIWGMKVWSAKIILQSDTMRFPKTILQGDTMRFPKTLLQGDTVRFAKIILEGESMRLASATQGLQECSGEQCYLWLPVLVCTIWCRCFGVEGSAERCCCRPGGAQMCLCSLGRFLMCPPY